MRIVIGLGGNQGDVPRAFGSVLETLGREVAVLAQSSLWRSAAQGPEQSDFINAAVLVETGVHPAAILAICRRLEESAGRDRTRELRWGPRPLDLDLLLAAGLVVESPKLTLPHPRLAERLFALAPAAEVAPEWLHPRRHRTLAELAALPALLAQRCERVGPFPSAAG